MVKDRQEQVTQHPETAGVAARPILLVPAAVLAGLVLDRLIPLPPLPATMTHAGFVALAIGATLFVAGLALFVAGVRNFFRANTPLPTNKPARVLVTTGIHGWTRNPVYLGFFLIYAGIGIAALSLWMLVFLLPLIATIRYRVVAREEAYLERRFGDDYRNYKSRVGRWM